MIIVVFPKAVIEQVIFVSFGVEVSHYFARFDEHSVPN